MKNFCLIFNKQGFPVLVGSSTIRIRVQVARRHASTGSRPSADTNGGDLHAKTRIILQFYYSAIYCTLHLRDNSYLCGCGRLGETGLAFAHLKLSPRKPQKPWKTSSVRKLMTPK